jgi:hypothetical protein
LIYVNASSVRGAQENCVSLLEIALESAMYQIDPQVKAAECERAIRVVADPDCRAVLISLRSLWVSLKNDKPYSDRSRQAVPIIAQIHAELMCSYRNAMN